MESYLSNGRPDLVGKKLGGVVLHQYIGSGGFGDVYISKDFRLCVKVLFREAFSTRALYEREVAAVKFISSCIREHCGIVKFFGGGEFKQDRPFNPYFRAENVDSHFYTRYLAVPITYGDDRICDAFYYLQMAADNLLKSEEVYVADTLGERARQGMLAGMTLEDKTEIIARLVDTLLFMYQRITEHVAGEELEENSLRAAHGDIKPDNILFVNGLAQLGDIGASLQINDGQPVGIGSPGFIPEKFEMTELAEKCGENSFAFAVFRDIYALGKVAAFLLYDGKLDGEDFEDSKLLSVKNELCSFHCDPLITPENVVEKLQNLYDTYFCAFDYLRSQRSYSRKAPLIELDFVEEFWDSWEKLETLDYFEEVFLVKNRFSQWRNMPDKLLAKFYYGWNSEVLIRREEMELYKKNIAEKRPILIYKIRRCYRKDSLWADDIFIVLSHSAECRHCDGRDL